MKANTLSADIVANERLALRSGIMFSLLFFVGLIYFIITIAPHLPAIDAPAVEIAEFYSDLGTNIAFANYLWVLPMPFFMLFLGGLASIMYRTSHENVIFIIAAVASGIAMTVPWLTNTAVETLGVYMAGHHADNGVVASLDSLGPTGSIGLGGLMRAIFLFAVAKTLQRTALRSRGMVWLGYGLAATSFIGSLTFVWQEFLFVAYPSLIFTMLWVLWLSISLIRITRKNPVN